MHSNTLASVVTLKFTIIAYSLIVDFFLSNYAFKFGIPYIVKPKSGEKPCAIEENACNESINSIQNFLEHAVNAHRISLSIGRYKSLPIATNMLVLESDTGLRARAQIYAETCPKIFGSVYMCITPDNEGEVAISRQTVHLLPNVAKAQDRLGKMVMNWSLSHSKYERAQMLKLIKSYDPKEVDKESHNLFAVMQANVWRVGCGFADFFISLDKFEEMVVCFFGPPKLTAGEELYKPGCVPCTHCPSGTSCSGKVYLSTLCYVHSNYLPAHEKPDLSEEEICYEIKSTTPTSSKMPATPIILSNNIEQISWMDNSKNGTQECRGDHLCSPGWKYLSESGDVTITVTGKCMSAIVFKEKIYIEDISCFKFHYFNRNLGTSTTIGELIAFAFEINTNGKNLVKEVKTDVNDQYISLDIPWSRVHIHVGLGTRSKLDHNYYETTAKDFFVTSGKCVSN